MTRCVPNPGNCEEDSWAQSGWSQSPDHGQSRGRGRSRARGRRRGRVQGQSRLAASVDWAVSVVAEAWAWSGHSHRQHLSPGPGVVSRAASWSVGHSFLSGCQTPTHSEREELHPGDQELLPPPPRDRVGPGRPRPSSARLSEIAQKPPRPDAGVQGELTPTPSCTPGRLGTAHPPFPRRVLRFFRPSPAGARSLQPRPHAALRRRLRGDVCVPHSAIRISRRGRHALLNLCLHAALTFTVFAGGINRTKYPTLCQAVSAAPVSTLLQSERVRPRRPQRACGPPSTGRRSDTLVGGPGAGHRCCSRCVWLFCSASVHVNNLFPDWASLLRGLRWHAPWRFTVQASRTGSHPAFPTKTGGAGVQDGPGQNPQTPTPRLRTWPPGHRRHARRPRRSVPCPSRLTGGDTLPSAPTAFGRGPSTNQKPGRGGPSLAPPCPPARPTSSPGSPPGGRSPQEDSPFQLPSVRVSAAHRPQSPSPRTQPCDCCHAVGTWAWAARRELRSWHQRGSLCPRQALSDGCGLLHKKPRSPAQTQRPRGCHRRGAVGRRWQ